MSGGSYNYLFSKSSEDIFHNPGDLERMVARLHELAPISDAALEAGAMLHLIDAATKVVQKMVTRLSPVFKAVEWYDSRDWGENQLREALDAWPKKSP